MQQNDNDCTHKNYVSYFLVIILIMPKEKRARFYPMKMQNYPDFLQKR